MKFWDMLKFIKGDTLTTSFIIIGYTSYVVIKLENKNIINNKLIKKLFSLSIPLYWFKNEYEFEEFFTIFSSVDDVCFVLIG